MHVRRGDVRLPDGDLLLQLTRAHGYTPAPRVTALGEGFYDEVSAARFPRHILRFRNQRAASTVGLGDLDGAAWERHFAAFVPLPGNLEHPLALRYHGHQFDVYNRDLGDGRGFLFAQLRADDGRLLDLGTKGSGQTPWSRGGDGRLTLKGGVREVLATEMLEALGVPTSRSFSLFETGEALMRGDEPSPTRSSVLVRLSHSHIRFGTFQRLAYLDDAARIDRLVSHALAEHFPSIEPGPRRVRDLLVEVTRRSAALTAAWMVAGFVHGVLNSDNMNLTGESFDYGPYRFLPRYDVDFTAAYFDHQGLYAFGRQPAAVMKNLARLAGALRPIAADVDVAAAIAGFEEVFDREMTARVLARLGLVPRGEAEDEALVAALYAFLEASGIGYDRLFFDLRGGLSAGREARALRGEAGTLYKGPVWETLRGRIAGYAPRGPRHPYFERDAPETLLIDEIEAIWEPIAARDDWSLFHEKLERIREMPSLCQ